MKFVLALSIATLLAITTFGCSDAEKARLEAEIEKAAQATAEAELAKVKAEGELAKAQAEAAKAKSQPKATPATERNQPDSSTNGVSSLSPKPANPQYGEDQIATLLKRGIANYYTAVQRSPILITEPQYDVRRSNSIVSPYTAIVTYKSCPNKELQDNEYAWKDHQDHLAWQDGHWAVTRRLMRSIARNGPLQDARSKDFLRVDINGRAVGGYVMDDLFQLQDAVFARN
jgi:hypothetical protein